ncbi:hypothetical protein LR48_Vigan03g099600 [Vigna angularis]|uniref:Transposase (putative) gypsy type domain-containing protein n=1 Tax=Phaseolus angularis TaxID=3914 RepID=A0A0L9U5B4_PHAAN|nr:hypothetical protein LR48_Vigan03g099600 [Vigna angularis]
MPSTAAAPPATAIANTSRYRYRQRGGGERNVGDFSLVASHVEKEERSEKRSEKLSDLLNAAETKTDAEAERKEEALAELKRVVKELREEDLSMRRIAAERVRLLAKEDVEARTNLAMLEVIPPLVEMLDSEDAHSQIASLYALLNLGISNDACVTMYSDFSNDEGRGYADDDIASPSSSLVAITITGARASPSGNSSDLLVDSDAPDEVAIHVDSTGAWDGKPRAWPTVPGYDWVPHEVRQISSSFHHRQPFRDLIGQICLVKAAADARHFKLAICHMTQRVCHDRGNYPTDFFYVYATMFKDLKVLLPFSDFQMGVMRTLNVAPTQLHPNGWAFIQAFSAICSGLALKPTPATFLYFFHVQPHQSKPWVSLHKG